MNKNLIEEQQSTEPPFSETLKKLIDLTEEYYDVQKDLMILQDAVNFHIKNGESTGDSMLDFVLSVCNGVYDPYVISNDYKWLCHCAQNNQQEEIVVVQQVNHDSENIDNTYVLLNVFMARLRADELIFNNKDLTMEIPVQPNYLSNRQFLVGEEIVTHQEVVDGDRLIVGPIVNAYNDFGFPFEDDNGSLLVPSESPCSIQVSPYKMEELAEYLITDETLLNLRQSWTRRKISVVSE